MRSKKLLITLAIVAMTTVPFSVFAATSDTSVGRSVRGFFGIDTSKLTDTQKADVEEYSQKLADLQKEFINKMVANGSITQEQADAAIKRIESGEGSGLLPGIAKGKEAFQGRGSQGQWNKGTNRSAALTLTDEQKADLKASYVKFGDLQKELIANLVSTGLITQEQGNTYLKKVDETLAKVEESGSANILGPMNGFQIFGVLGGKGAKTSTLTDEQKALLQDYATKLTALQKEVINKLVSYGALTQEQGNAAIQRLENTSTFENNKGISRENRMGNGQNGKSGNSNQGSSKKTDTSTSASKVTVQ